MEESTVLILVYIGSCALAYWCGFAEYRHRANIKLLKQKAEYECQLEAYRNARK